MDNLNQNEADASNIPLPSKDNSSDGISFSQNPENNGLESQNNVTIDKISTDVATSRKDKTDHSDKKKKPKKKHNVWWIKAVIISLVLSAFFSYISNLVEDSNQVIVVIVLLAFLVLMGILFDAIGVAVTSCDVTPIISMASRKVYGAKTALNLVKNSDTVSSVCNDIVGDIFSIISGACSAALVVKLTVNLNDSPTVQTVISIVVSALVSAMTIGGKAFMKKIAIDNSKDFVMFVARVLAVFSKDERKIRKKNNAAKTEQKSTVKPAQKTDKNASKTKEQKANKSK